MSASEDRTSQTRRSRRRGNRGFGRNFFEAYPTKSNSWKYVRRIGDRLTLTNGEEILPLDMEGRIRQEAEVKDAIVFGIDKPVLGLLVFRANTASNLSDEAYINNFWPAIEDANSRAEGFAQINREMTAILPPTVYVPMTAKSSIMRAQIYRDFLSIVEVIYSKMENNNEGNLKLDIPELEQWIISTFSDRLGIPIQNRESDFHASRVDNLEATQMRSLIIDLEPGRQCVTRVALIPVLPHGPLTRRTYRAKGYLHSALRIKSTL